MNNYNMFTGIGLFLLLTYALTLLGMDKPSTSTSIEIVHIISKKAVENVLDKLLKYHYFNIPQHKKFRVYSNKIALSLSTFDDAKDLNTILYRILFSPGLVRRKNFLHFLEALTKSYDEANNGV